jgi:hypothetical protein
VPSGVTTTDRYEDRVLQPFFAGRGLEVLNDDWRYPAIAIQFKGIAGCCACRVVIGRYGSHILSDSELSSGICFKLLSCHS